MKDKLFLLLLLSGLCLQAQTQVPDQMTLEQVIERAVQNNPDIKIGFSEIQIAENNVFKGNAGLLPVVNTFANLDYQNNISEVDIRTFQEMNPLIKLDESGVETTNISVGARADYTLYDGGRAKSRFGLLQLESERAKQQQELMINGTVLGVKTLFFEIVKIQNQIELLQESIKVTEQRLERVKNLQEFGKANKSAILNTQTDLNQDLSSLDDLSLIKENLLTDLNFLLGLPAEQRYELSSQYSPITVLESSEIRSIVAENNPEVKLNRKGVELAAQSLELSKADRLPRLGVFAQAVWFRQENDLQQLARLQTIGPMVGLSASHNLFDGGVRKNQINNGIIRLEVQKQRTDRSVERSANAAIKERNRILLLQRQLQREEGNLLTFEDNFARTEDRFAVGKANLLDVRTAQLALLNAKLKITNLQTEISKSAALLENYLGE